MSDELKKQLTAEEKWFRLIYMIFFFVVNYFAQIIVGLIALVQFVLTLFTGKKNERLLDFGQRLSQFIYQIMRYLTYDSEDKPYPFGEWPSHAHISPVKKIVASAEPKPKAKPKVSPKPTDKK